MVTRWAAVGTRASRKHPLLRGGILTLALAYNPDAFWHARYMERERPMRHHNLDCDDSTVRVNAARTDYTNRLITLPAQLCAIPRHHGTGVAGCTGTGLGRHASSTGPTGRHEACRSWLATVSRSPFQRLPDGPKGGHSTEA